MSNASAPELTSAHGSPFPIRRKAGRTSVRVCLLIASMTAGEAATLAQAVPPEAHYIGRLGFRDPKHTREDGYQQSIVLGMTPGGYTFGESARFAGQLEPGGMERADRSAWMASPAAGTRSVGLYDAVHTSSGGSHNSTIQLFTKAGKVAGTSERYAPDLVFAGTSTWIADWNGGTHRIGLYYEGEPRLASGARVNEILAINEKGQTIGIAAVENGQSAWFAEPDGTTRAIGFYDPAHTAEGMAPFNTPVAINASGTVIGNTSYTVAAWLQPKNGGPAIEIGLFDAAHSQDGVSYNTAVALNARGRVIGTSLSSSGDHYDGWLRNPDGSMVVFNNSSTGGTDVVAITDSDLVAGTAGTFGSAQGWVYDIAAGSMHPVGLPDYEVGAFNKIIALTENGVAIGSASYYGMADKFLWLAARNGPTRQIGLLTQASRPPVTNEVTDFNDAGYVVGISRVNSTQLAWIANPLDGATYPLGIVDARHTGPGSSRFHVVSQITNSRFVAGHSLRYAADGTTNAGQTAWVYNSPAGAYVRFDLSTRVSDGYSYSEVRHVTENGTAFGVYRLYDAAGEYQGERAFVWMTKRGVRDLGAAVDVDLSAAGWKYLEDAVVGNEAGFIAGQAKASAGYAEGAFLVRIE